MPSMVRMFVAPSGQLFELAVPVMDYEIGAFPRGTVEVPLQPVREGYSHEWDAKAQEWVATKLPDPEPVEQPPTVEQLQAAIEAVAKAAGLSDKALDTVMESVGISRRVEVISKGRE